MRNGTWLASALVVSVAMNVYLFATRPAPVTERAADTAGRPASRADQAPQRGAPGHASGALRAPAAPQLAAAAAPRDDDSAEREADLAAQLASVEADLAARRPLDEQFQLNTRRSPDVEAQIQGELDQVFGTKPGSKAAYTVECHGQVCELHVDLDQDRDAWMGALQHEYREPFEKMMFQASGPTYLGVRTPEQRAATSYVRSLFAMIRSSPDVERCKLHPSGRGEVVLTVRLDVDRRVRFAMAGPLADRDFGACLRPVLERISSQAPSLPANIRQLSSDVLVLTPISLAPSSEQRRSSPKLAAMPTPSTALPSTP